MSYFTAQEEVGNGKVPRFQKERVRIIEVRHSLPEGNYAATENVKYTSSYILHALATRTNC